MADILRVRTAPGEPWTEISVIQGPKGDKGDPGATYTITAADYDAIADVVLTKLPSAEGVSY